MTRLSVDAEQAAHLEGQLKQTKLPRAGRTGYTAIHWSDMVFDRPPCREGNAHFSHTKVPFKKKKKNKVCVDNLSHGGVEFAPSHREGEQTYLKRPQSGRKRSPALRMPTGPSSPRSEHPPRTQAASSWSLKAKTHPRPVPCEARSGAASGRNSAPRRGGAGQQQHGSDFTNQSGEGVVSHSQSLC